MALCEGVCVCVQHFLWVIFREQHFMAKAAMAAASVAADYAAAFPSEPGEILSPSLRRERSKR